MKILNLKKLKLLYVNLIAIAFLLPSFGGVGGGLYAQDHELFNYTWYLHKIVLDDGTEHIPVPNNEVPFIELIFFDDTPYQFETAVCNIFFGTIEFDPNQSFTIQDSAMTLIDCNLSVNSVFEGIYFGFFMDSNNNHLQDPFPYNITTNGNEKTLTITNVRGDEAIYGDQILSSGSFESIVFSIYPNPVNDTLNIYTSFCDFCTVKIYSPNGKLLYNKSLKASQDRIDVKQLGSGIYFLVVENEVGIKQTQKFVKK